MLDSSEEQNDFLRRVIPLSWQQLTRIEKNELVHIWIMGKKIGGYVPNYCGDYNAAMEAVKKLQHVSEDVYYSFLEDLPPLYSFCAEDLVLRVMRVYGYKG